MMILIVGYVMASALSGGEAYAGKWDRCLHSIGRIYL